VIGNRHLGEQVHRAEQQLVVYPEEALEDGRRAILHAVEERYAG
jgi:hypothetical protein